MAPPDVHVLILEPVNMLPYMAGVMKDLEKGRVSWISRWAQSRHTAASTGRKGEGPRRRWDRLSPTAGFEGRVGHEPGS